MRPEIEKYETRKKWLNRAALTLGAPFLPLTLLERGMDRALSGAETLYDKIKGKLGRSSDLAKDAQDKSNAVALPPESPIEQRVARITERLKITNLGTTMQNPDAPFTNAFVRVSRFTDTDPATVAITFVGNPYISGMSPAAITGVIGHEIGHGFTSDNARKRIQIIRTAQSYTSLGIAAGVAPMVTGAWQDMGPDSLAVVSSALDIAPATLTQFVQALPPSAFLYSASAIALAIGYSMRHLSKLHSHSTEHLADLHGAEITSPAMAIAALEHLLPRYKKTSSLKAAWDKVAHPENSTHPDFAERITVIKKSFDISDAPKNTPQPF